MIVSTKVGVAACAVLALTGYSVGRWSAPEKVRIETKLVEVEKKVENTKVDLDKDKHKETTVTVTENKDGTKTTVTKTTEDTKTDKKTETVKTDNITKTQETLKVETNATSKVTLALLAGTPVRAGITPVYGLSVTKPILGPITLGFWGLTSEVVGLSLGLTF